MIALVGCAAHRGNPKRANAYFPSCHRIPTKLIVEAH